MARLLIRQAHGGETRIIGDGALPYFLSQGYVVLDDYDDSTDNPPLYLSKAESDLRYARLADLGDPESAEGVIIAGAAVDAVEDATTVAPVGTWDFAQAPTVAGVPLGSGTVSSVNGETGAVVLDAADVGARPASYTPAIADLPGGSLSYVDQNPDGTWPNRRTSRTDVKTIWTKVVAASADPASVTSPAVNGAYANDLLVGV